MTSNTRTAEHAQVLDNIYGTTNFFSFFDSMRNMVQDFLLGGTEIKLTKLDFIMGYTDDRVRYMFNTSDFFHGKEVMLNRAVSPIFQEKSPLFNAQKKGIYTGSLNVTHSSKIRFLNEKNYINQMMYIFNGIDYQLIESAVTNEASITEENMQVLNTTNGVQFPQQFDNPQQGSELRQFNQRYLQEEVCTQTSDDATMFGSDDDDEAQISTYEYKCTEDFTAGIKMATG